MGEMTVEKHMVGLSVDLLLKQNPERKLIEIVNSGDNNYTVCYDNEDTTFSKKIISKVFEQIKIECQGLDIEILEMYRDALLKEVEQ